MARSIIEEKMEAARKLARVLSDSNDGSIDSIYIAGSLTAGLGNPTSDADLFVLYAKEAAMGDDVSQYNVDGHRVDVERYTLAFVEEAVGAITSFRLQRDNLTDLHKLPSKLDFVCRLYTSETLLSSPALEGFKQRIVACIGDIRQVAVNYSAIAINGHLEDFLGASVDGDLETAALVGQDLTAYAGKAVAAASGDLYYSKKWVYKQLARNPVEGFPTDTFTDFQRGTWTGRGPEAAEELIFFVQTCIAVSQLLSRQGVPLDVWPAWTAPSVPAADGLWRNPSYNVLGQSDGILLHWELRRQLMLRDPAAFVWALCDGRGTQAVVEAVARLAEHVPALKTMTAERVEKLLQSLRERDLVRAEPFSALSAI
ncbi:PqqD family protein [Streptomyces sp. NBC_01408]|uniref:PqqD family protein n=1 Tax=Streptomyces sp. NBC_01408 TaxID=2903855 RepID=UPI00225920BC|nr:PqqD family protein [Streptomyces sp. NBC_01408]MCX4692827.1 PqqD family protein [Streptomyces sp. NBC_01408]